MNWIINLLLFLPISYLAISGLYQFILAVAAHVKSNRVVEHCTRFRKFLVLVPAYKEDAVILATAKKNLALKYSYPDRHFDFVVISDSLQPETNKALRKMGAQVHEVQFEKSTKVKSLQSVIRSYSSGYDAVVLLDADNVMNMGFLHKANQQLAQGHEILQGRRVAANQNSAFAMLDGLSEAANTHMLCQGANNLGLSSKLSGSAMVLEFNLFVNVIDQLKAIGGFDKEMELILTQQRYFIEYVHDLTVTDEKVASSQAFARQRGRWLEAQYSFLKKFAGSGFKAVIAGNTDHFHKVAQLALPPRALAPFLLIGFTLLTLVSGSDSLLLTGSLGFLFLAGSYALSLPTGPLFKNFGKLLATVPSLIGATFKALKWMKRSRVEFLHTTHTTVQS